MNKIYPPTYKAPAKDTKPKVSDERKAELIDMVKAHMTENRAYQVRELLDLIQAELYAENIHIKNDEIVGWLKELEQDWGWHPTAVSEEIPKELEK